GPMIGGDPVTGFCKTWICPASKTLVNQTWDGDVTAPFGPAHYSDGRSCYSWNCHLMGIGIDTDGWYFWTSEGPSRKVTQLREQYKIIWVTEGWGRYDAF